MSFTHISAAKAKQMISEREVTVVDIRDPEAYATAHIEHARLVNNGNIASFVQEADFSLPLLVYCYHGNSSQGVAVFFAGEGFKEVYSLDGGFDAFAALKTAIA